MCLFLYILPLSVIDYCHIGLLKIYEIFNQFFDALVAHRTHGLLQYPTVFFSFY